MLKKALQTRCLAHELEGAELSTSSERKMKKKKICIIYSDENAQKKLDNIFSVSSLSFFLTFFLKRHT